MFHESKASNLQKTTPHYVKAINNNESPVKEKHVRRIIIDSYRERSTQTFWSVVRKLPLQENQIVCWKFCHVLHKLLREGHPRAVADAYPFRQWIRDLGKSWGMLKEGYGKLIQNYCSLVVTKIDFHARNVRIPGSLQVSDEELDEIGERDVNVFFQLSCEMFDYLDEILNLQHTVFGSLDMSRANSMTNAGQCRLAPLIPCIQDSSQLYDYSVKVLFKLHGALPPGTLDGHRNRFLVQFKALRQFYLNSSNLQYFRYLIQIPLLPETPPNFLLASDIKSHVTPVVILPQHSDSPDGSEATETLIDLTFPNHEVADSGRNDENSSVWSFQTDSQNGSSQENRDSTDLLINRLKLRVQELELEMHQIRIEDGRVIDNFRRKLTEAECNAVEHERAMKALEMDKDNLQKECEELKQEMEKLKNGEIQTETAKASEKLNKFKEVYNQLREEHIELLRSKAETDKLYIGAKSALEREEKARKNLEEEIKELTAKLDQAKATSEKIEKSEAIEALNKKLLSEIALLQKEKLQTEGKLSDVQKHLMIIKNDLEESQSTWEDKINDLKWTFLYLLLNESANFFNRHSDDLDSSTSSAIIFSTPDHFFSQCEILLNFLYNLEQAQHDFPHSLTKFDAICKFVVNYYSLLSHVLDCGKVIYQMLPSIDLAHELMQTYKNLLTASIRLNQQMGERKNISEELKNLVSLLSSLVSMKSKILPQLTIDQSRNLEKLLTQELSDLDSAIEEAVSKLEEMMVQSKNKYSGVALEVNERILDSCTTLMQAIVKLVKNSKELQKEIIVQGKGSASPQEFYQRNHRWTEGLISAAKVVALAAKLLVEAADKVITGQAKYEELMVASNEVAAATAQLVVASRVKAESKSVKLLKLSQASKEVKDATANVLVIAQSSAQNVEESETMDFSKLTLHQAKKMEMESQVRVLELENELGKERIRLSSLRKRHYHMGGG